MKPKSVYRWAVRVHFHDETQPKWYYIPQQGYIGTTSLEHAMIFATEAEALAVVPELTTWADSATIQAVTVDISGRILQALTQAQADVRAYTGLLYG